MISNKVIIVDSVHPSLSEKLNEKGMRCETNKGLTYEGFLSLPDEYAGLIIRSRFVVDKSLILHKKQLKFIVRIGSGVENIDTAACEELGIVCISTPEGNANAVAEHALGMLLCALKNIPVADQQVRNGIWERHQNKGHELASQVVGIIGYGHTGPALARILHLIGCRILVYDKFKTDISDTFVESVSLERLCAESDVVSLNINYLPDNHYFINKSILTLMKRNPIFINTSRGLSVNTSDLLDALDCGLLRYACLDVLEFENTQLKIPNKNQWDNTLQRLSKHPKVLLTPHIAGQTFDADRKHAQIAVEKISELLAL